jgi:hypothetical protein
MNIPQQLDELTKKVDELQKLINHNSDCIMEQSIIIQKLIEKLVVIPTYPSTPSIDPHFGKDIPYVPYKGPDCEVIPIRDEDNICGGLRFISKATPVYHVAYDGTKTTLPVVKTDSANLDASF